VPKGTPALQDAFASVSSIFTGGDATSPDGALAQNPGTYGHTTNVVPSTTHGDAQVSVNGQPRHDYRYTHDTIGERKTPSKEQVENFTRNATRTVGDYLLGGRPSMSLENNEVFVTFRDGETGGAIKRQLTGKDGGGYALLRQISQAKNIYGDPVYPYLDSPDKVAAVIDRYMEQDLKPAYADTSLRENFGRRARHQTPDGPDIAGLKDHVRTIMDRGPFDGGMSKGELDKELERNQQFALFGGHAVGENALPAGASIRMQPSSNAPAEPQPVSVPAHNPLS
jgi:hypothetical protein